MADAAPLLVVVALVAVAAALYRRREGHARRIDVTFTRGDLRELGVAHRQPTLLLFTAPACGSCAAAKRVLDDVGGRRGLPVVVADVTEHHAIAAEQHVFRAPTVFVVDHRGHAIARISGVPHAGELDALQIGTQQTAA